MPTAFALIVEFYLAILFVGGALGYEVEHARGLGGTIQRTGETVDDFDLLVFLKSRRSGDCKSHAVLAVVLHVGSLHATALGAQNLGSLLLSERDQRQVLGDFLEISRLRVVDQLTRNHVDRVRKVHDRHGSERTARLYVIDAICILDRAGRDIQGLQSSGQRQSKIES